MKRLYHRLLLLIAGSTQQELARQVRYLKIENQILRSKLKEQAEAFLAQLPEDQQTNFLIQHDRDTKFTAEFDDTFRAVGGKVFKSPFRSPNLTAYVERVIQTLRVEALDYFLFFAQKHLDYVLATFARFYNQHRPDQSKGNFTSTNFRPRASLS